MKGLLLVALLTSPAAEAGELLVFAAASTTEAMREVGASYEAASGTRVRFSFAGSNELSRQITESAPADVFLSADEAQMDRLVTAGRVRRDDVRPLLSNRLVIVQPKSAKPFGSIDDLRRVKTLALADPEAVPAGIYAKKLLIAVGTWDAVRSRVIPTLDVRAALAAVEKGRAEAGIVYATDVGSHAVTVTTLKGDGMPRIVYPVAPLTDAGRPFAVFLERSRAVFEKYGFKALP